VVAISPFNYPALLVLHKVAPALASGNAVILKPARSTPLTALALAQCFLDAGLPEGVLSVITGSGSELGNALVSDKRARKISFTGSTTTGEYITSVAGIKKLSLELGASCPVIILKDADLELAATAIALGGFVNAGQVCISVQRVIVDASILADFLSLLTPKIQAITTGNPLSPDTKMGTLINQTEARRVKTCIDQAVNEGAKLLMGSDLEGTVMQPAVLTDVNPYSAIAQDELFGPAIAISEANSTAEAIELANSTNYGLGSGVFTKDISAAIQSAREIDSGIIDINWTPLWRADLMPYGGLKSSGIGKEGVRSAVTEMTEEKTIVLHGTPWGDKK
jgi:glyceraldehyde-3-phosphate dehydrogenase (NADP+)